MVGRKDLFCLHLFLALSIIISYGIKNVSTKNSNYITVNGISKKEILLTSSSWNLQYDLNGDMGNGSIKVNNFYLR
ncbi:SIMPL domain-containing protein [Borreliella bavariensis]|uniref:SIMPL domain-containing protein n=1 Tax=Borreliella bavariensis TaxID=664662 RepID=UPI001C008758|nr:SIMPL domain-containing protein [Borreliella bavariensis]